MPSKKFSSVLRLCVAFSLWAISSSFGLHHPLNCAELLQASPGVGQLLGIVVGGRGTGGHLPRIAKLLGYQLVHIYPSHVDRSIQASFCEELYDHGKIVYEKESDLTDVDTKIRAIAARTGLHVAGFVPGMDYGVNASDILSAKWDLPGNGINGVAWRANKGLLNQLLERRGVPVVRTEWMSPEAAIERADKMTFPVFVKPASSWGSIGAGPSFSPAGLKDSLTRLVADQGRLGLPTDKVVIQDLLHPDRIYFVDTISATSANVTRRVVTGVWIDQRGNDFPKEVWDYIYMLPPPSDRDPVGRALFENLEIANARVLAGSEVTTGATHLEFMAPGATVTSADELKPTDLNHRLPGVRTPDLEERANGFNPYMLDIMSRTRPELFKGHPARYSRWNEHVALIFVRNFRDGKLSAEGRAWLESLRLPAGQSPPKDAAYLTDIYLPPAGTPMQTTRDGATMAGILHAAGPSQAALDELHRKIRERERAAFFLE